MSLPDPEFVKFVETAIQPFAKLQFPDIVQVPDTRILSTSHLFPLIVRFPVIIELYPAPRIVRLSVDIVMFPEVPESPVAPA